MSECINPWLSHLGMGILFGPLFFLLGACKSEQPSSQGNPNQAALTQGIKGKILWFEGNLMPSPDVPPPAGQPIIREIFFCKPAPVQGAQGPLIALLPTDVVLKVTSNAKGEFEAALVPGTYSIFVKETTGFFVDYQTDKYLSPCVVEANKVTEKIIKVDYKATY